MGYFRWIGALNLMLGLLSGLLILSCAYGKQTTTANGANKKKSKVEKLDLGDIIQGPNGAVQCRLPDEWIGDPYLLIRFWPTCDTDGPTTIRVFRLIKKNRKYTKESISQDEYSDRIYMAEWNSFRSGSFPTQKSGQKLVVEVRADCPNGYTTRADAGCVFP